MAMRNSSAVPIKGLTDKRNVTLTFFVVIYQGKTDAGQPGRFKLPNAFAILQNLKHYLNEQQMLSQIVGSY